MEKEDIEIGFVYVYVVIAYRWGSQEMHSYLVYTGFSESEAINEAEKEANSRGGKYECWVYKCEPGKNIVCNSNIIFKTNVL